jgi:hypothetical protein
MAEMAVDRAVRDRRCSTQTLGDPHRPARTSAGQYHARSLRSSYGACSRGCRWR